MNKMKALDFKTEYLERWRNSKNSTLALAQAMPEESYNFGPTEEVRTFGEQMVHIGESIYIMGTMAIEGITQEMPTPRASTKEDILMFIAETYDFFEQKISTLEANDFEAPVPFGKDAKVSRRKMLITLNDHLTHHKAQALVSLRMNNIQSPGYIGW